MVGFLIFYSELNSNKLDVLDINVTQSTKCPKKLLFFFIFDLKRKKDLLGHSVIHSVAVKDDGW